MHISMSPQELLAHYDAARLGGCASGAEPGFDLAAAYQSAVAVRQLRQIHGEVPRGYKTGFTNREIWPRYQVFAPIWGTVWDSTLQFGDGEGSADLNSACQPRLEPEAVFGLRATPLANAPLTVTFRLASRNAVPRTPTQ